MDCFHSLSVFNLIPIVFAVGLTLWGLRIFRIYLSLWAFLGTGALAAAIILRDLRNFGYAPWGFVIAGVVGAYLAYRYYKIAITILIGISSFIIGYAVGYVLSSSSIVPSIIGTITLLIAIFFVRRFLDHIIIMFMSLNATSLLYSIIHKAPPRSWDFLNELSKFLGGNSNLGKLIQPLFFKTIDDLVQYLFLLVPLAVLSIVFQKHFSLKEKLSYEDNWLRLAFRKTTYILGVIVIIDFIVYSLFGKHDFQVFVLINFSTWSLASLAYLAFYHIIARQFDKVDEIPLHYTMIFLFFNFFVVTWLTWARRDIICSDSDTLLSFVQNLWTLHSPGSDLPQVAELLVALLVLPALLYWNVKNLDHKFENSIHHTVKKVHIFLLMFYMIMVAFSSIPGLFVTKDLFARLFLTLNCVVSLSCALLLFMHKNVVRIVLLYLSAIVTVVNISLGFVVGKEETSFLSVNMILNILINMSIFLYLLRREMLFDQFGSIAIRHEQKEPSDTL